MASLSRKPVLFDRGTWWIKEEKGVVLLPARSPDLPGARHSCAHQEGAAGQLSGVLCSVCTNIFIPQIVYFNADCFSLEVQMHHKGVYGAFLGKTEEEAFPDKQQGRARGADGKRCYFTPSARDLHPPAKPRDIQPRAVLSLHTEVSSPLPFSSHLTIMDFSGSLTFQLQLVLLTSCPFFGSSFIQILMDSTCLWLQMLSLWGANVWMHWSWVRWSFGANPCALGIRTSLAACLRELWGLVGSPLLGLSCIHHCWKD